MIEPHALPLVEYFNEKGLTTCMSCEGHSRPYQTIFWVSFTDDISEEQIIEFQKAHSMKSSYGEYFCSYGRFAMRTFLAFGKICHSWNYFASDWASAYADLEEWKKIDNA